MTRNNIFKITVAGLAVLFSSAAFAQNETLIERPVANTAQALQGLDPSLNVYFNSGSPFAESYMTVRGVTSAFATAPLILVDGVEYKIENINPYSIESVTILKDAAAAAIYGARAAAGAIIIKTKTGDSLENLKPQFEVNANVGFSNPLETQDKLAASYMNNMRLTHNYNVSAKGGTNTVKYYFGGRYYGQDGEYSNSLGKKNGYDNFNFQGNLEAKINKFMFYNFNTTYSFKRNEQPYWSDDQTLYTGLCGKKSDDYVASFAEENSFSETKSHNYMLKNALDFRIIKGLDINVSYAFNYMFNTERNRSNDIDGVSTVIAPNRYSEGRRNVRKNDVNAYISYRYDFKNGMGISAKVGGQYLKDRMQILTTSVGNLIDPTISALTAGDGKFTIYEQKYKLQRYGAYGNLGFNMGKSLDVAATFRYDNSSRFDKEFRNGYSYSASASWDAAQEKFMEGVRDYISVAKIRFSHAQIANQQLPFVYPFETSSDGIMTDLNSWIIRMNGSLCDAPADILDGTGLKSEKVMTENAGLDLAFLHNRLSFSADFMYRNTTDMLRSISEYDGDEVFIEYSNGGYMKTIGLEFSLGWKDAVEVASRPLTYGVRAMFADYNSSSNIALIGLPRYNYTVNGSLEWYGVDFSFMMNGTGKQDWNQLEFLEWDTYFAKDNLNAGYFRLKNVSLGYTVKFKKVIDSLRIGVSGENLCYASPFKKYSKAIDPQMLYSPVTINQYQRALMFNVKVNF